MSLRIYDFRLFYFQGTLFSVDLEGAMVPRLLSTLSWMILFKRRCSFVKALTLTGKFESLFQGFRVLIQSEREPALLDERVENFLLGTEVSLNLTSKPEH